MGIFWYLSVVFVYPSHFFLGGGDMLSDLQSQAVKLSCKEIKEKGRGLSGRAPGGLVLELPSLSLSHSWVRDRLEEEVWKQVAGGVPWCSEFFSRLCRDSLPRTVISSSTQASPGGAQHLVLWVFVSLAWGAWFVQKQEVSHSLGVSPRFLWSPLCTWCRAGHTRVSGGWHYL